MQAKLIIALVFALLVAIFAIQNAQTIDINFLMFTLENCPVAAVIIVMLGVGVILGMLISAPKTMGKARRIKELENLNREKDAEIQSLQSKLQQEDEDSGNGSRRWEPSPLPEEHRG